jgi:hypothetical protein
MAGFADCNITADAGSESCGQGCFAARAMTASPPPLWTNAHWRAIQAGRFMSLR